MSWYRIVLEFETDSDDLANREYDKLVKSASDLMDDIRLDKVPDDKNIWVNQRSKY